MAFGKTKESTNKTIILCAHCGDMYTSLTNYLCCKCKSSEKRATLDEQNAEIFANAGLKFKCAYCTNEKIREKEHAEYMKK